jgi:hypothetical protein
MDIIFPSVSWTLKPFVQKNWFFALANAIDTDQGNPFEVAVNYCLKRILYLPARSHSSRSI